MSRLSREESHALTRAKLLASARDVIAREGYEGATIDRIAEDAGFTKGAFYANFSSKEEIVLELLETHSLADLDEIAALLGDEKDPLKIIDLTSGWTAGRSPEALGGLVFELTYGSVSTFKKGPAAADLVRLALTALYLAHSKRGRRGEGG